MQKQKTSFFDVCMTHG